MKIPREVQVVVGFALYLVTFSGGPFQVTFGPGEGEDAWTYGFFAQLMFFTGIAAGCFVAQGLAKSKLSRTWSLVGGAAYVLVTIIGVVIQVALDSHTAVGVVAQGTFSIFVGAVYAQPLLFWLQELSEVSQRWSRFNLAAALFAAYLPLPAVIGVSSLLGSGTEVPVVLFAVCSVASAAVMWLLLKPSSSSTPDGEYRGDEYRLTPYLIAMLACLGFSWGIAEGWNTMSFGTGWLTKNHVDMFLGLAALALVAVGLWALGRRASIKFGMFMRLALVVCGGTLVAVPLSLDCARLLFFPLCELTMVLAEITVIVLSLELSREKRLSPIGVFAKNYATFVGAAWVAAIFFFLVQLSLPQTTAWGIVTVGAIWVVLAVIPFLPSRTSDVVAFAMDRLPEEEGYSERVAQQKERISTKYNLSESESEVLGFLLLGMDRSQIAEKMYLSPWTIKARISQIYKKCDVHSYKDLVKLASLD